MKSNDKTRESSLTDTECMLLVLGFSLDPASDLDTNIYQLGSILLHKELPESEWLRYTPWFIHHGFYLERLLVDVLPKRIRDTLVKCPHLETYIGISSDQAVLDLVVWLFDNEHKLEPGGQPWKF